MLCTVDRYTNMTLAHTGTYDPEPEVIEYFETLREVALIDHLTQIHNRRYLYDSGELLFNNAKRNGN